MLSKAKHLSIESSIICHFERQRKIYIIYIKFYFVKSKNLANCHFERSETSHIKPIFVILRRSRNIFFQLNMTRFQKPHNAIYQITTTYQKSVKSIQNPHRFYKTRNFYLLFTKFA